MLTPPIGVLLQVTCRTSRGGLQASGQAFWQYAPSPRGAPGSGSLGGGIGIDMPQAGGMVRFSIGNLNALTPAPHLESVWIVAPTGTVFEYCEVNPIRPNGRTVRPTP
jgi:hypothetical protein